MIKFEEVSRIYDGQTRAALANVNVEIDKGEFVFLVGGSGSGKSTMLKLVLREFRPTTGRIYVAGRDVATLPERKIPALRREIGMVSQDFRLLPGKTVFENVLIAKHMRAKQNVFSATFRPLTTVCSS